MSGASFFLAALCLLLSPQAHAQTVSISPNPLPDGAVGVYYSQTLVASSDDATATSEDVDAIVSGTLPTGLTFDNTTSTISGTPTATGLFTAMFHVTVHDDKGVWGDTVPLTITINPAPPASAVPTLGAGALIALMLALGIAGIWYRRSMG